jgi:hypothetical protein
MATVTPLTQPEGAKPSEIQIEIQNVIDARRKLQNLIAELNKQQAEAELAFLREFSLGLAALKVDFDRSFVDGVFNKYTSVKQTEDQITQRATALGEIATKIDKRINELKQNNREDLMLILKRDLEKLMLARTAQDKETGVLDAQIRQLQDELSQLEKAVQRKTPETQAEAAPQPPKGKV